MLCVLVDRGAPLVFVATVLDEKVGVDDDVYDAKGYADDVVCVHVIGVTLVDGGGLQGIHVRAKSTRFHSMARLRQWVSNTARRPL